MEVTKIKTGRQKSMEAEKLIEALHTVEKLKRTMRHCYTSDDRKESVLASGTDGILDGR